MNSIQRIEPFTKQCDFTIWLKKFELIMKIGKVKKENQADYLLTSLDVSIFESVVTSFSSTSDYDDIVQFLTERYSTQDKFLNQLEFFNTTFSGTCDEYASKLQLLFESFDITKIREEILIMKFISTAPKALATELRIRRPTTLSECVKICNSLNAVQVPFTAAAVSKVKASSSKPNYSNNRSNTSRKCYRCGSNSHVASDRNCPAKDASCNFCKKIGHFSSVCTVKQRAPSEQNSNSTFGRRNFNLQTNTYDSEYFTNPTQKSYVKLSLSTDVGYKFGHSFLVDSGSDVCTLPLSTYQSHFTKELQPFHEASLRNFDSSEIKVLGILPNVSCEFLGKSAKLDFLVCDVRSAVLGANAISKLQLTVTAENNQLVTYSIHQTAKTKTDMAPAPLPKINGFSFSIKLKPDAPNSLIQNPRRIPFAMESEIEKEISKLLQNDIIEEIDSSPYLSPIVVVPKEDGSIRLCVDYRKINQHIEVDQHPLPTAEEIFAKLTGAKYFSKLDLKSAYHQLEIQDSSRDLTAFTCHLGQFRYKRMPFGLANAPSAYMKLIFHVLKDCKNTTSYLDDILIFGDTIETHDACLKRTLKTLQDYGFTLNEAKCQYNQTSIQFLGRVLSSDGVSPLPKTLEAILNAPVPHDKQSLRSFLGLINFYRNFIPNAASISSSLYDLLKENVPFSWQDKHQEEFDTLKNRLSNCLPLAFYDSDINTPTFLTTDASGYGISAVLSQRCNRTNEEKPVYFLSRKLSDTEKSYSASEKEFLAVLWSIEKLHQYLYGRPFTVRTDHQPLKQMLTNGYIGGSAPCRVIRWATRLLQYNFTVNYIPGKNNYVADALSRVPQENSDSHFELFAVSLDQNSLNSKVPVTLSELKIETQNDDALQILIPFISQGWPSKIDLLPTPIRRFWNVRTELSFIDGVILRGDKYVIPAALQDRLVKFAHEGHMGISKCKTRLREYYWWPNLNQSVESQIRRCPCCVEPRREAPVQVPDYAPKPWHQIAVDIKGPLHDSSHRPCYIIVLVDCFTKMVTTRACSSVTSHKVIEFLNHAFSLFGHCTILTSDNGPQFISYEFCEFLRQRGIIHRRASLYNPQSNGVCERVNRNLNKLLQVKDFINISDLQGMLDQYVLNYNSAQHSTTGKAPSELMLSYKMKTNLNMMYQGDVEEGNVEIDQRVKERSARGAAYTNGRRRPLTTNRYEVGDRIVTKRRQTRTIVKRVGPYTFELDDGFTINVRNILKRLRRTNHNDTEQNNSERASHSVTPSPHPRRSTRSRRPPSFLQDYAFPNQG